MARRNGNNNFLNIMRSMLSFLDTRIESSDIDASNTPGGVFMNRLRSRLVDLISGRIGDGDDGREDDETRAPPPGRDLRGRGRKVRGSARQEVPSVEERNLVDRCNRMMNETEERPTRERRRTRAVSRGSERNGETERPRSEGVEDPVTLTTSIVVTGDGLGNTQAPSQSAEAQDETGPRSSRTVGSRGFRVVFPRIPSQELRFLFLTPQSEGSRGNIIYEIQINFDVFEASSEAPTTATKESLKKSSIVRAVEADKGCECAICMSNFIKNQRLRVLPCDHRFHVGCVDKWLLGHSNKCPVCRTAI
ncbi:putative protein with zinc finger domain [Encephalitozoon cuniculi GB-M1]|uniref:Uncharacterized RING finger protein ECU07_0330 n=2 Tax=Encephalitozoon cuniculi TaxID=6035 RepID=Y733_ENCCU|nr:RING-finger domain-containing ubiquitin ligase [Encephalitozoon cuniculi GB-M1]Q8SV35.2 RecName: Full=Uncharacterized RING finger protein ECU07_0330 [Encephalitozoon cuniculi GB-M1]KMV65756.1 RING-finger domain-containing ubiquitin ligase [Encephalitozoon cuniculi EcunIII-L]UYI27189.1 RING-H2 finger protein ATL74 [Encephalitozoon cuniculi]CAD25565.2 putative protein with zinc finger domain [Encephalitozoon cuniculi GB-M1]